MKRPPSRSRDTAKYLSAVLFLFAAVAPTPAATVDNSWDIAVIDRVLASAKPGEDRVKFGDVGMRIADLKVFRDRLAGEVQSQAQREKAQPLYVTPPGTAFKWPGGVVNYRFDPTQVANSTINAAKMQAVRDAVAEWAAFANLTFNEFSGTPPANYITVQEKADGLEGGFSSAVGMAGGEQFVQIGQHSWNRGTICHEVGHALGLYHEQSRDDRDTYVTILTGNIISGQEPNFAKIPGGSLSQGAYDFYSVMHYSRAALTNKTGTPNPNAPDPTIDTIDPTAAYVAFLNIMGSPYNRILSKLDRSGMAQIYGNPSASPSALVTNTNDSGPGSLRTAIYYAFDKSTDAPPVPTTVTFHIPTSDPNYNAANGVFTIKPTFILTAPGAGTTIDGSTQTSFTGDTNPNGPEIVMDGSQIALENLSLLAPGFLLREANCTIKNLVINGFNQEGIAIDGTRAALFGTAATGNVISGCYIGTDKNGTTGIGNGNMFAGIIMFGGAHNNTVGGTTTTARNVISGSTGYGISIQDAGSNNNVIEGNFIGLNATGTGFLSNAFHGVAISGGAQNNIVGTTTPGAGNVISGNTIDGVFITGANTNNNVVQGNSVGLNANGSAGAPNGGAGVDVANGPQSTIVGPGNVVSGNAASGVIVNAVNGTMVQGNYIGTNPGGTIAIPNSQAGVYIAFGAQNTTVGGPAAAARNVISGNTGDGIDLNSVSNTTVQGNYIGVDFTGGTALPNGTGIALFSGSTSNTIGGPAAAARNIISGNTGDGLNLNGVSATTIQGNYIGLDFTGVVKIGNGGSGVDLFGAATNTAIGGTAAGARNFICGSGSAGLAISGSGTNGNVVQGNTIGMNVAGTVVANGQQGIALFGGAQSNTIGGTAVGASNIISGNTNEGVALYDSSTIQNSISQNSIFANSAKGIVLNSSSNSSQVYPTALSGSVSTAANPNGTDVSGSFAGGASTLQFFANPTADPSGFGEGQFFIGSLSVAGAGSFIAHLAAIVPAGYVIAATATSNGNTSEFSQTFTVPAYTDNGNDGTPDQWMLAHFGHIDPQVGDKSRATDDADSDGMTNLQEFKAGTDPKSSTSQFRISSIVPNAGNYQIGFPSVLGKTYRLEYRDDLVTGNWTTLTDQIFGTGATIQINDPSAAGLSKRFYRLSLEP